MFRGWKNTGFMKKYLAVIILMVGIAFTACAHSKKSMRKKKAAGKEISVITMSRGACFGRCPVYTLSIIANGLATYEGRNSTEFKGTYQKQLGATAVAEIFKRAGDYRVDTLKGDYVVSISDLPGLDFIFTINGKEKKVHNAGFGPRYLSNFARFIDETVAVDSSWKKTKEPEPQN